MALDLAFCGTYTDPSRQAGFEASPNKPVMGMTGPTGSAGIYVFRFYRETGALTPAAPQPPSIPHSSLWTKPSVFCSRLMKFANSADRLQAP